MIWPFKKQADEAERLLAAMLDLHKHLDSAVAGGDFATAEKIVRHAVNVLKARAVGMPAAQGRDNDPHGRRDGAHRHLPNERRQPQASTARAVE